MSPANPSAHARRNAASPKGRSTPAWPRAISLTIGVLCVFTTSPAHAQVSFDGGGVNGGAVRIGASSTTCDATTEGAIKYVDASNRIELCDDSAWIAVGGGGGGSIDGLSDAVYDTVADHNMRIGSNTSMFAGAQYNLFIGEAAGTTGASNAADYNIAIGYQALDGLTTGDRNVVVGADALSGDPSGNSNVAVGTEAMNGSWGGYLNTALGARAMRGGSGQRNTALGGEALINLDGSGSYNIGIGADTGDTLVSGSNNILINGDVPAGSTSNHLNIGDTVYGDLANDRIRIGGSGAVSAGPFIAVPPSAQTIAGANTITANACGTIKAITASGTVTTNTTDTFTNATPAGCCMDVVNTGGNQITLDANTRFKTAGAADVIMPALSSVRVCSDGTNWYQVSAVLDVN